MTLIGCRSRPSLGTRQRRIRILPLVPTSRSIRYLLIDWNVNSHVFFFFGVSRCTPCLFSLTNFDFNGHRCPSRSKCTGSEHHARVQHCKQASVGLQGKESPQRFDHFLILDSPTSALKVANTTIDQCCCSCVVALLFLNQPLNELSPRLSLSLQARLMAPHTPMVASEPLTEPEDTCPWILLPTSSSEAIPFSSLVCSTHWTRRQSKRNLDIFYSFTFSLPLSPLLLHSLHGVILRSRPWREDSSSQSLRCHEQRGCKTLQSSWHEGKFRENIRH